jgi:acetate kinase
MTQAVITVNSGSSSIKFAFYSIENNPNDLTLICQGEFAGIPHMLHFSAHDEKGILEDKMIAGEATYQAALSYLLNWIKTTYPKIQLTAAGHRIVHGGERYTQSVRIDQNILKYLDTLIPLAPLHQPHNLAGIRTLQSLYPALPQVACFDTSFHHTLPRLATLFALPQHFWDEGIRRFGFHGLSYRYISETLPQLVGKGAMGKVVVAHLGHGASMCALKDLKSFATTMGLTVLEGLPMGTRCGNIDPGVILYLASEKGYSIEDMSDLLYKKSGLLGLSEASDDMQELLRLKTPQAREAIDYFCYHIQRNLGSLVAALGGLDTFVFTGGIGENAPLIRQKVCEGLKWLNIEIDEDLNTSPPSPSAFQISASKSGHPSVWVIPTNEEIMIAKDVLKLTMTEKKES